MFPTMPRARWDSKSAVCRGSVWTSISPTDRGAAATCSQSQLKPIHSATRDGSARATHRCPRCIDGRGRPEDRGGRRRLCLHLQGRNAALHCRRARRLCANWWPRAGVFFSTSSITTFQIQSGAAVHEAAQLGVSMLTVHAGGGGKMLRAAAEAAQAVKPELLVLAVTVLDQPGRVRPRNPWTTRRSNRSGAAANGAGAGKRM